MQTAIEPATPPAPKADPDPGELDERRRARSYLDLWERQLVRLALDGPVAGGRRPPRE